MKSTFFFSVKEQVLKKYTFHQRQQVIKLDSQVEWKSFTILSSATLQSFTYQYLYFSQWSLFCQWYQCLCFTTVKRLQASILVFTNIFIKMPTKTCQQVLLPNQNKQNQSMLFCQWQLPSETIWCIIFIFEKKKKI